MTTRFDVRHLVSLLVLAGFAVFALASAAPT